MPQQGPRWGTDDDGAIFGWTEEYGQALLDDGNCPAGSLPQLYERDGKFYPVCSATGIFYAPPADAAVLLDLLFPDEWSIIPPG